MLVQWKSARKNCRVFFFFSIHPLQRLPPLCSMNSGVFKSYFIVNDAVIIYYYSTLVYSVLLGNFYAASFYFRRYVLLFSYGLHVKNGTFLWILIHHFNFMLPYFPQHAKSNRAAFFQLYFFYCVSTIGSHFSFVCQSNFIG